ncbi:hypothetical protein DYB32_009997, partial [Aphanomyces invadans]
DLHSTSSVDSRVPRYHASRTSSYPLRKAVAARAILFDTVRRLCVRPNLEPPTKNWITILTTKLSTLFEVASESNPPPFCLPSRRPPLLDVSWIIRSDDLPIVLTVAKSRSAKLRSHPVADSSLIPTKHLNLPTDFYADPKRLKQLAVFSRPDLILPQYGEFIYKTLLRANALQYLFKFRVPQPTCVFCGSNETYHHFLFICRYDQSLPKPPDGYYVRGYLKIWPVVRACVYYQIWLQRADRTFRPDLPPKTPLETAIHATSLIKMHLTILLRDLPLKKDYTKVFNVLRALSDDAWLKAHLVPPVVNT